MPKRPTLAQARAQYVHRFTLEHIPQWATHRAPGGQYYAPQFASDQEWYDHTLFPGEPGNPHACRADCYTTGQTWPLGQWLEEPYEQA